MIISDLNLLEVVEVSAVLGGSRFYLDVDKDVNVDRYVDLYVNKEIYADAYISGNIGDAESSAYAYGWNSLAETETVTFAYNYYDSGSYSSSLSAAY